MALSTCARIELKTTRCSSEEDVRRFVLDHLGGVVEKSLVWGVPSFDDGLEHTVTPAASDVVVEVGGEVVDLIACKGGIHAEQVPVAV